MANDNKQQTEVERTQQQNVNPEKFSITDEEQRINSREDGQQQKMPVGNEQNNRDNQGTLAGTGE